MWNKFIPLNDDVDAILLDTEGLNSTDINRAFNLFNNFKSLIFENLLFIQMTLIFEISESFFNYDYF